MFAKLRPHHKRAGSTPTSPTPPGLPALVLPPNSSHATGSTPSGLYTSPQPPPGHFAQSSGPQAQSAQQPRDARPDTDSPNSFFYFARVPEPETPSLQPTSSIESPISPFPPTLPPIPRIASVVYDKQQAAQALQPQQQEDTSVPDRQHSFDFPFDRPRRATESSIERHNAPLPQPPEPSPGLPPPPLPPKQALEPGYGREAPYQSYTPEPQYASPPEGRMMLHANEPLRMPSNHSSHSAEWKALPDPGRVENRPPLGENRENRLMPTVSNEYRQPPFHSSEPRPQPTFSEPPRAPPPRAAPGPRYPVAPVPRTGKTKLNLLNPMSLLLRRRSAHPLEPLANDALATSKGRTPPMRDNFEVSIRGTGIHDFSAPRTRRNFSAPVEGLELERERERERSMLRPVKETGSRTPVFKENFEEDGEGARAEMLENRDFVARNSRLLGDERRDERGDKALPVVGEGLEGLPLPVPPVPPFVVSEPPPMMERMQAQMLEAPAQVTRGPLSPLMEDGPVSSLSDDAAPDTSPQDSKRKSTREPPQSRASRISHVSSHASRTSRVSQISRRSTASGEFQSAGLPAHMFSRSSRFSFQYAGVEAAAQERALEEAHTKKERERRRRYGDGDGDGDGHSGVADADAHGCGDGDAHGC
ncbi:hypothetical protein EJ06DRAFT_401243 [Trichodelitschia bisporula]|uniref:Uncharacterized protein n=1 Tax=Trichodelitschia bisporula TaxID=703511 RepID=A0A6G1HX57_9PEZI|nr:hypothetical protein EJ06DRAFT_401243 [Trichodelitschia bisporula]